MRSDARNLKAICEAMDQHAANCGGPLLEIRMSPYEVDRLDWPDVKGVPVVADGRLSTGIFQLICGGQHSHDESAVPVSAQTTVKVPVHAS